MIKLLWIFVLGDLFLLCLPGHAPDAEEPGSLTAIEAAFSSCVGSLDAAPHYAPLAVHGFLAPPSRYSPAQLTDPGLATPIEARLVADFQAADGACEVNLRIDLMNVDTTLSDLASQRRQLTDVNELLLIEDKQSWGEFSTTRVQIEMDIRQASAAVLGDMTGQDEAPAGAEQP